MEVIIRRISKDVVVCVQDVVGKNNLPVKFEYRHNRYISASLISYIYSKYDVCQDVDDTIYDLPKILQGDILTIDGYPVYEEYYMFEKVFYLSIFYCLCFINDISENKVEEKLMEDIDSDLKRGGYLRVYHDMDDQWKED